MTDSLSQTIDDIATRVVAQHSTAVDRDGAFPEAGILALGKAGALGILSATEVGGLGLGPHDAAMAVERVARECGSTAMVLCMHLFGAAVLEKFGPRNVRQAAAAGKHLSTLSFSEEGSRSPFLAPVSTAGKRGGDSAPTARKSFVTSAHHAPPHVWSCEPH